MFSSWYSPTKTANNQLYKYVGSTAATSAENANLSFRGWGEQRARSMPSSFGMGISRCRVAYQNDDGVHSVEVTAVTLYEAVACSSRGIPRRHHHQRATRARHGVHRDRTPAADPAHDHPATRDGLGEAEHERRPRRDHAPREDTSTSQPATPHLNAKRRQAMIDHIILTVSDIDRSLAFYQAALAPLKIVRFR